MAQNLLDDLIHLKIQTKSVVDWLTAENSNDPEWTQLNEFCSREEFSSYFLTYLKDQFSSVLQSDNISKPTPAKKIPSQANTTSDSLKLDSTALPDNKNNTSETDGVGRNNVSFHQQSVDLTQSITKKYTSDSVKENVTPKRISILDANKSTENQQISNTDSPHPQTSTPVIKKKTPLQKKRVELFSCNSSQNQYIHPAFKDSVENSSLDGKSFPSLCGNNSSSFGIGNSPINNKNESFGSYQSNVSPKSMSNKSFQSPASSLYSSSVISPINIKGSQSRYSDNQLNNSYYQQNATSTPERTRNSTPKNSKGNSRQNFSLGDYIVTDSRSSKKNSGKKNNLRKSRTEENRNNEQSLLSDTSSTHLEQNTRRRKVNPTRLNITDEKGSKNDSVFGVVSRPLTQNPHFVNVSPVDKSTDNESFQIERGLVKMERQKNPEINSHVDVKSDEVNEQSQPRWKILPRTPNKAVQLNSVVIPNIALVQNVEIVNVLAELYSEFLNHNLVFNPMSELYSIIHLITIQYTKQLSSTSKKVSKKIENQIENRDENLNSSVKSLSLIRKSLNFDDLEEKSDITRNSDCDNQNIESLNNLESLKCEENINFIDDKLVNTAFNDFNNEKNKDEDDLKCIKAFLDTPHNTVYFSTKVLNYQKAFLKCLDRATLKLLCENNSINTFQPELCNHLSQIYKEKVAESQKDKSILSIGIVELNVCFQIDTDNRENFPSSIAFQSFRRQRDMFYELLKIWQDNHLVPGWTFQIALSGKIKALLSIHQDITNFTHFTRLFKSQMLISCIQTEQQEDLLDDETASFLKNLKDINPEKLSQLQRKLVTPLSQNGPVPLPSFSGIQEFYKDFILHASHPMFYTYLENTFIHEIMELNNSRFAGSDIEETETQVDENTKQNFIICLSSLKLLSKFLGFMTSLPYKSETSMLEEVISSQIVLRSECLPHIDLQHCVQLAIVQGKLSLTVPWIVEYLSMMDHASFRLPYYKRILEMLYCIYRASNYYTISKSEELMSEKTAVLIKLTIGWLFELPVFPTELYYTWQSKYNVKALKLIFETQQSTNLIESRLTDTDTSVVSIKHSLFLDKLDMIDEKVLYICCPFLRELKILLTPGTSNVNNSISYRHVTPVSSKLQKPVKKADSKSLEIQLEEAFFHGQPMSTRKTVEYVSERVASTCIKYICSNLLPSERQLNIDAFKKVAKKNSNVIMEKKPEILKNLLLKDMNLLAVQATKQLKEKSLQTIPKMCESRITQSMESLLAEDCLKPVKDMCVKIALRMAMGRIDLWIQSHISSTFMKDMELEINKGSKVNDSEIVNEKCHNPNATSPTDVLDNLRIFIWDMLETGGRSITLPMISDLWDRIYQSLTERSDLKSTPEQMITSLSVDFCLFLIILRYDLFTNVIQEKIFKIWKIDNLKLLESDSPLLRILSPRNVFLMLRSGDNNVWLRCGQFLKTLLDKSILSINTLTEQAVAIFRNEWPITISKSLSLCLQEATNGFKSSDEETERVKNLLTWVAGACSDMDCDSFAVY